MIVDNPINVTFNANWGGSSDWYAELNLKMTNNTGSILNSPVKIQIGLAQEATASGSSGFTVTGGTEPSLEVVGVLDAYLTPVQDGASVEFSLALSFPNGGFDPAKVPTGYWVNGQPANGGNPDTNAPTAPTNVHSTGATSSTISLA